MRLIVVLLACFVSGFAQPSDGVLPGPASSGILPGFLTKDR
jgi:hypothetical protein